MALWLREYITKYGGIFDIGKKFQTPHCSHRFGRNADLSMSVFNGSAYKTQLLTALNTALTDNGFSFPVSGESPTNPTASHWHVQR